MGHAQGGQDDQRRPSRRVFGAGVLGTAAAALAACSSNDGSGRRSAGGSSGGGGAGFPATVSGRPSGVTVPKRPERVVAVGYQRDVDLALALDLPLVGAVTNGNFSSGFAPWQDIGADVTRLTPGTALPFEKIAALRPDLILASDDYTIDKDFATLSGLAPTLGRASDTGEDTWQTMLTRAGAAVAQPDKAATLISAVESSIKKTAAQYPQLAGKTFTFGPVQDDATINPVSRTKDANAVFFASLGMSLTKQVLALPGSSAGRSMISLERLDLLDADVLMLTYVSDAVRKRLEADPLFKRLPVVRRGAYVPLDLGGALALAFPSTLSIEYGLRTVVPLVARAAART